MRAVSALTLVAFMAGASLAGNTNDERNLKGLTEVDVLIGTDIKGIDIDQEKLKDSIEMKMRNGGLQVSDKATPHLFLQISSVRHSKFPMVGIYIRLELREDATVKRTGASAFATVWKSDLILCGGLDNAAKAVEKQVSRLSDDFLKAWLAANPK